MESQLVAYIDESSAYRPPNRQEYMICAAIIDSQDLEQVREELRPLLLPGQVKLHWTDERNSRRRKIVETLSGIDSMQAIITHQSEVSKRDRKSTRLNSSHVSISYAVFCWKKKKTRERKAKGIGTGREM